MGRWEEDERDERDGCEGATALEGVVLRLEVDRQRSMSTHRVTKDGCPRAVLQTEENQVQVSFHAFG